MDKYLKEIEVAIQKAAIDGALSEAAVEQFHSVIQQCADLTDKCVSLEKTQDRMEKEKKELDSLFAQTSSTLSDYQTRERELVEREKQITELEMSAKHEHQRVMDHKEMFKTVFRNSVLRRGVVTPIHVSESGMHGSTDLNTVEEEET